MDHSRAPVLEALREFRRRGDVVFGPPGHKQGRGADPRVADVVGMISPYPPGVPVVAPGEASTEEIVDYLRGGVGHGVLIPDAADPSVRTFRVVAADAIR